MMPDSRQFLHWLNLYLGIWKVLPTPSKLYLNKDMAVKTTNANLRQRQIGESQDLGKEPGPHLLGNTQEAQMQVSVCGECRPPNSAWGYEISPY